MSRPGLCAWQYQRHLATGLLVAGAVNGFVVRVMESWYLHGGDAIFFGISPFELVTVLIAVSLMTAPAEAAPQRLGWPELLFMLAILVPSSAFSWLAVAIYALVTASRWSGERRIGALLFFGLAACSLWSSVAIKWFALPLTSAEAFVVWSALSFFRDDLIVSGNVLGVLGGHKVVLLLACSTAYLLPKALLALSAIAASGDRIDARRLFSAMAAVTIFLALANWARLAIMTWSAEHFEIAHGAIGANIFDVAQAMLILGTGYWVAAR